MLEWSIIVKIKEGIKKMGPKEEEREMKLKDFHVKCSHSCCAALGSQVLILLCGQTSCQITFPITLPKAELISHHLFNSTGFCSQLGSVGGKSAVVFLYPFVTSTLISGLVYSAIISQWHEWWSENALRLPDIGFCWLRSSPKKSLFGKGWG